MNVQQLSRLSLQGFMEAQPSPEVITNLDINMFIGHIIEEY